MVAEYITDDPWAPERWTVRDELLDESLPLVTIGILNYNRKDELRRTLDCVTRSVEYPNIEVIVVDNASTDGSREMISNEFSGIQCIQMERNIAVAARNEFYRAAQGKYIFSYDDDSYPATPASVYAAVLLLESRPDISSMSFFCYQPRTGFAESGELSRFRFSGNSVRGFEGLYFVEGGMCIRREAFLRLEGYDPDFIWGAEGADLTLQMYKLGLKTLYYPSIATLHLKSQVNRQHSKNAELFTRNYLWTIAKHFPLYAAFPLSVLYVLRRIFAMFLHPDLAGGYVRGVLSGILGFARQRQKCKKLGLRQVLGLKRWYLFLFRW